MALYDGQADWEIGHAIAHIRSPQWQRAPGRYRVTTVGLTTDPVRTAGGIRQLPEIAVTDLSPATSAMLILPGSDKWHIEGGLDPFAHAARTFLDANVPVAAICGATFGLARAGLLDDRAHTSGAAEYLASSGYGGAQLYRAVAAVTDKNLITAGPTAPVEFAREIFATLGIYDPEVLDAWYRLFGNQDVNAYWDLANAGAQ